MGLVWSLADCAHAPHSSDLRRCARLAAAQSGGIDRLELARERDCMAGRGWAWVIGQGYVRVYVERDRAREIEAEP